MKIYQVADVHLGRRRLDGRLPEQDFSAAFDFVADAAVADQADVVLIVGDLFDRSQVEPEHLRQAQTTLTRLRRAGIVVIAVEGNHDRASLHSSGKTWVQFLGDDDLLVLLRPRFNSEGAVLEAWNETAREGAYFDYGGVRFVGAGYLGAATPAKVRQILARLDLADKNILLLHAGPDYFVGEGGGFSKEDLRALESSLSYLALGHIHRPMMYGGWACNPGSLENCDLREAASDRPGPSKAARGYAVIEIDPQRPGGPKSLEIRANPRRPVHKVELDCTPFGNKTKHGAESLVTAAVAAIAAQKPTADAVVDLHLTGRLNLNRIAMDQEVMAGTIGGAAGVVAVAIDTTRLNVGVGMAGATSAIDEDLPRDELERRAIQRLLDDQSLWGLEAEREWAADFLYQLKEAVRTGKTAEELAAQISTSPLVGAVREAKARRVGAGQPEAVGGSEAGS